MRVYRAYLTDESGRFSGVKFLNCESDTDALKMAERLAAYSPVHVWDRDRFIQTVERHRREGLFARLRHRLERQVSA
jgi:hypothetical protein